MPTGRSPGRTAEASTESLHRTARWGGANQSTDCTRLPEQLERPLVPLAGENRSRTRSNTEPAGLTLAKSVALIVASGHREPKISCADRPSTDTAVSQHATSRVPSTGARDRPPPVRVGNAYRRDIALSPRPAICGNTNHIQCERLRPARTRPAPPRTFLPAHGEIGRGRTKALSRLFFHDQCGAGVHTCLRLRRHAQA